MDLVGMGGGYNDCMRRKARSDLNWLSQGTEARAMKSWPSSLK